MQSNTTTSEDLPLVAFGERIDLRYLNEKFGAPWSTEMRFSEANEDHIEKENSASKIVTESPKEVFEAKRTNRKRARIVSSDERDEEESPQATETDLELAARYATLEKLCDEQKTKISKLEDEKTDLERASISNENKLKQRNAELEQENLKFKERCKYLELENARQTVKTEEDWEKLCTEQKAKIKELEDEKTNLERASSSNKKNTLKRRNAELEQENLKLKDRCERQTIVMNVYEEELEKFAKKEKETLEQRERIISELKTGKENVRESLYEENSRAEFFKLMLIEVRPDLQIRYPEYFESKVRPGLDAVSVPRHPASFLDLSMPKEPSSSSSNSPTPSTAASERSTPLTSEPTKETFCETQ